LSAGASCLIGDPDFEEQWNHETQMAMPKKENQANWLSVQVNQAKVQLERQLMLDNTNADLEIRWQMAHYTGGRAKEGKKSASVRILIERSYMHRPTQSAEKIAAKLWPLFHRYPDLTRPTSQGALIRMLRRMGY
jgi:hypothetical protein